MLARLHVLLLTLAALLAPRWAMGAVPSPVPAPPHLGGAQIWGGQGASAQEPVRTTEREALSQPEGGHPLTLKLRPPFDTAGNTLGIAVNRPGTTGALCTPSGAVCSHRYAYSWDEVGRLSRARRWDGSALGLASSPLPVATPNADLSYAYDASDMRVRTTVTSEPGGEKHTLYVFPSLELRKTSYVGAEYTLSDQVETVYLMAGGERLAKVLASTQPGTVPLASGTTAPLVLLHMQDALGSVSSVVDKASGELVESRGYRPYGDEEHSLRTGRWQWLREDYGFTGKEADVEVGLTYFGKRYLVPQTGRWLSPDPLALHVPGKADLNLYAYVNGRVFVMVDPFGLDKTPIDMLRQGVAFGLGAAAGMVPMGGDLLNAGFKSGMLSMPSEYKQLVGLGLASTGTTMAIVGATEMGGGAGITIGSGGTLAIAGVPAMAVGAVTAVAGGRNAQLGLQMAATNGSGDGGVKTKSEAPMTKASKPGDAAKPAEAAAKANAESPNMQEYGGPGGGHHVPAKKAFQGAPNYDPKKALAIPNSELERLGLKHSTITGAQQKGYTQLAKSGGKLSWDSVAKVETDALVKAGMKPDIATKTVGDAIDSLKNAGVAEPTQIPWGGK